MGFCRPLRRRCVLPLDGAENRLMLFRQLRVTVGGKHIGQITPRMPLQQTQQTLRQAREHHIMCRFRHNLMKRRIGRRLPFRIMLPVSRLQLRKPIAQTLQIRFRPPLRRQTCKQTLHTAAEIQYLVGHIVPAGHLLPTELQSLTHPRGNIMSVPLPRIKHPARRQNPQSRPQRLARHTELLRQPPFRRQLPAHRINILQNPFLKNIGNLCTDTLSADRFFFLHHTLLRLWPPDRFFRRPNCRQFYLISRKNLIFYQVKNIKTHMPLDRLHKIT